MNYFVIFSSPVTGPHTWCTKSPLLSLLWIPLFFVVFTKLSLLFVNLRISFTPTAIWKTRSIPEATTSTLSWLTDNCTQVSDALIQENILLHEHLGFSPLFCALRLHVHTCPVIICVYIYVISVCTLFNSMSQNSNIYRQMKKRHLSGLDWKWRGCFSRNSCIKHTVEATTSTRFIPQKPENA